MQPHPTLPPGQRRSTRLAAIGMISLSLLAIVLSGPSAQARQIQRDQFSPALSQPVSISTANVITIGVAVDLSGPLNSLGWQEANSVRLAISQTNAAGGVDIGGTPYAMVIVLADKPLR